MGAQKPEIIQYFDIAAAIANPTQTLGSTVDACGSSVTKAMGSKLSKKEKKKSKNVTKCFKMDVSKLSQTQAAVSNFIGKVMG